MDETLSHDWISAYADGELSPEERVRVEEKLRESPESMQELLEIRVLSGLIGEAISLNVPPDFSSQVMRQAEQESLIGKPPITSPGSHRRSRSLLPIVTVCSSVACLALVLFLISPGARPDRSASPDAADVAANSAREVHTLESTAESGVAERFADAGVTAPEEIGVFEADDSSHLDFAVPMRLERHDGVIRESLLKVISPINLKENSEIGDVVRALMMSADQVAIVELTVVDRQQGIDNLQFILSGLNIKDDPSALDETRGQQADSAELYTVLVEASPSQMRTALKQLQEDMDFATVEVSTTISVDELEPHLVSNGYASVDLNRSRMYFRQTLDQGKSTAQRRMSTPALNRAASKSNPATEPKIAAAPKPASATSDRERVTPESPPIPADKDALGSHYSRQMIVRLPEKETSELIARNKLQLKSEADTESRKAAATDHLKKLASPEEQPLSTTPDEPSQDRGEAASPEPLPVQVLFVLRSEQAESPLPAPKPSPR